MFICGVAGWFVTFVSKLAFAAVGENITINIRSDMYISVLQKHMGWHDNSDNAQNVKKVLDWSLPDAGLKERLWEEILDDSSSSSLMEKRLKMEGFW